MVPEINKPTLLYSPSHLVIINHTHSLILNTHNLLSFFLQQSLPFHFTLKTLKWFFSVCFLISSLFESSLPSFSFSFSFSFQIKMIMSGGNRFPFTASQWQELEHQALIYKYMVSGIPIPPDLLFTIKRSVCLDSSKLFPHQHPHFAWSCFQMGLGRKTDPEPGRCRRTDGKKWRCSKEAYPDSKYCERHMHRGKNRSRKPVEVVTQRKSTSPPTVSSITRNHSNNSLLTTSSHSHLSLLMSPETQHQNHLHYPAGYHAHPNHQFLSSSTPTGIGLLPQENSTHLLLDSGGSSMTNTDFRRSVYGLKEEVDEHAFFSEPSGSMRSLSGSSMDDAWQLTPLTMNSSSSSSSTNTSKQRSLSSLHNEYSYLQLQSLCDHDIPKQQKQHQHHYLLGNDISNLGPMKMEKEEPQKTVHRFFDEWPPKNKESWLDLDNKSSNSASVSTTRLSISIPSSHDFPPIFNSRTNNDG